MSFVCKSFLLIVMSFFISRYDPEDKEITSSSSYGKFEVFRDSTSTRLKVHKPNIQDTGVYKLNAVNQGTRKTVELFLNVLGKFVFQNLPFVTLFLRINFSYFLVLRWSLFECFC